MPSRNQPNGLPVSEISIFENWCSTPPKEQTIIGATGTPITRCYFNTRWIAVWSHYGELFYTRRPQPTSASFRVKRVPPNIEELLSLTVMAY